MPRRPTIIWRVGPVGDRLLRRDQPAAPRARRKEPSLRFVDHRLAVADTCCALALASRAHMFELLAATPEPASWRRYGGAYGEHLILKPDLFAVTADLAYEHHWFIEIDRGTESLPTLLKKCADYEMYRATGQEQTDFGVFPRVVWSVVDADQRDRLRRAIDRSEGLDAELFRVAVNEDVVSVLANEHKGGAGDDGSSS